MDNAGGGSVCAMAQTSASAPASSTGETVVGKSGRERRPRTRGPRKSNAKHRGGKHEQQDGAKQGGDTARTNGEEASAAAANVPRTHKKIVPLKQPPRRNPKRSIAGDEDMQKPPAPSQTSQSDVAVVPPPSAAPVDTTHDTSAARNSKQRECIPKRNAKSHVKRSDSDADSGDKQAPALPPSSQSDALGAATPSAPVSAAVTPPPAPVDVTHATSTHTGKKRAPKPKRNPTPCDPNAAPSNGKSVRNDRRERKPRREDCESSETLQAGDASASTAPAVASSALTTDASETKAPPPPRKEKAPRKNDSDKSSTAATEQEQSTLPDLPTPANYEDAAWFAATGGDLRFAQWLFGRSQGMADVSVVQDPAMLARVHQLYTLEKKVQCELQSRPSRQPDSADVEVAVGEGDDDDAVESLNVTASDSALWSPAAIVEDVARVLRVSRLALWTQSQTRASNGGGDAKQKKRTLERTLVKELVENATDLLLSRTGFDDIAVLERWVAFVALSDSELALESAASVTDPQDTATSAAGSETESTASAKVVPSKRGQKRQERQRKSGKDSEAAACEMVRVCIAFLRESHAVASAGGSDDAAAQQQQQQLLHQPSEWPAVREQQLASELKSVYLKQRITEVDELRRQRLASDLQQIFRRRYDGQWRQCEVILFGSSLSLFGATGSDLDMCLLMKPSESAATSGTNTGGTNERRVVGARELRALINGKSSAHSGNGSGNANALDMVALQELRFQVKKSIEKITLLYNSVGQGTASRAQLKQLQQLRFFRANYTLLLSAIDARVAALSGASGESSDASAEAVASAAALRVKQLVAKSRRQSEEMFRMRATLERAQCSVRSVISGARIPIIRFTHVPTKFECDLCFENVLATRNTFLLRAYARFDERARVLGMAVKHWAKQRTINDASMGYLSSYSYVLLAVYFLQAVAHVLPNLQDPELLSAAQVAPELHAGVNIAFCTDMAAAQQFHMQQLAALGVPSPSTHSFATLLVWFFEFYATKFDFARRVVAVRSSSAVLDKHALWGLRHARSWRMSIQDPLETSRDLGCVLQFKGQEQILREFKRAYALLCDGKSFAEVAEPVASVEAAGAGAPGRQQRVVAGKGKGNGSKPVVATDARTRGGQSAPKQARTAAGANKENGRNAKDTVATDAQAKPSSSNGSDKPTASGQYEKSSQRTGEAGATTERTNPRVRKTDRAPTSAMAPSIAPIAVGASGTA